MRPGQLASNLNRPLLPNWASIALTVLAAVAVVSLVQHLAKQNQALEEQNRLLREAQRQQVANAVVPRTPQVGDRLPAIELVPIDGAATTVGGALAGGGVVAFLTTTCPFCQASLEQWSEMATGLAEASIPFVAISLDDLDATRTYAAQHGIPWPVWTVADASDLKELGVNSVPVTVIVSAGAEITQLWRGQVRSADVKGIVDAARQLHGS